MTVYAAKGSNTGVAVVVFPGGGYQFLAMDLEGTEICDWLTSRGITCVLLKYRVPGSGPWWDAFGLRPSKLPIAQWPWLVETWLGTIGMVDAARAR